MALPRTKFQKADNHAEWFDWCRSLLELYHTDKQFVVNRIHRTSFLGMRRWILGHNFTGAELILRNMLLDAMVSADNLISGSESYVPWFLYNDDDLISTRLSSTEYLSATLNLTRSSRVRNLFQSIYDTVGPLTKIVVKNSYENVDVIKYRNSFRFPLSLDAQFHRMIGNVEHIDLTNPIVLMIEGAPETIGEINSLLQWNHESQRPVVLIARNFPEEISATLATNWIRNSLNILPIPYGLSIESINLAADMCAVTKGELISAHFGDVISASVLNEDKWGQADRVEWTSQGLYLHKQVDVSSHVRNLITKLKSIEEEEIQDLYRDRILSLSNDAVEIWINKEDQQVIEELDSLIKHYNGFVRSGLVETPIGEIPKCFADVAKLTAQSFREEILNIGGFLVGVNDEVVVGRE